MLPARIALIVSAVPIAVGAILAPGAMAGLVPSALAGQPDLVVEQIYSITEVLMDGKVVRSRIYVDVGNYGSADAGASKLHFKMRDLAGRGSDVLGANGPGHTASGFIDVGSVPAGASITIEIPFAAYASGSMAPGAMSRYHVTAVADAGNVVSELVEMNNALESDVFGGDATPS